MSDIQIIVAGVARTTKTKANSCSISSNMNGRASARVVFLDVAGGWHPALGESVSITIDGTPRFAGRVWDWDKRNHPGTDLLEFAVTLTDKNEACDRRVVTGDWENATLGSIVGAIVAASLSEEGITTTGVETGPTITEKVSFRLNTVTEAFNKLSQISGNYGNPYLWRIDELGDLKFAQFAASAAPFGLSDTSENFRDLRVRRSMRDYRNVQYVRGGTIVAPVYRQTWTGNYVDGVDVYITHFPITEEPKIFVNDVPVTCGPYGTPGFDFQWVPTGDWYAIYRSGHAPLTSTDVLAAEYVAPAGTGSSIAVEDANEIATRKAIEGGSGRHEAVEEAGHLNTSAALQALGAGLLKQKGKLATEITFQTDVDGLDVSQRIPIGVARYNVDDTFLIDRVERRWVAMGNGRDFFRCDVHAVDLDRFGVRTQWLEKLVEVARGANATTPAETEGSTGGGGSGAVFQEVPKGVIDGLNTVFTLTYKPSVTANGKPFVHLFVRGATQNPFYPDYTVSGNTITFTVAPPVGSDLWCWYFHGGAAGSSVGARRFNGGTDALSWGHGDVFNLHEDMSIGMWLCMRPGSGGVAIGYGYGGSGVNAEDLFPYWLGIVGSSGAWDIRYIHDLAPEPDEVHTFDTNIPDGKWRYIGLSRDAAAKAISLYVGDGSSITLIETRAYVEDVPALNGTSSRSELVVGNSVGSPVFGAGVMDIQEHYLWDRKLTAEEHEAAMKGNPPTDGLVLACAMGNDPEYDSSGNGHIGTVIGTTLVARRS